jgi:hypothetical protein
MIFCLNSTHLKVLRQKCTPCFIRGSVWGDVLTRPLSAVSFVAGILFVVGMLLIGWPDRVLADESEGSSSPASPPLTPRAYPRPSPRAPAVHHRPASSRPHHVAAGEWVAVAVSLADGGASWGYARRRDASEATMAAIQMCSQYRRGCYAPVSASRGCLFVTIATEGSDPMAWGTGATAASALSNCQSQGVYCKAPGGGCG